MTAPTFSRHLRVVVTRPPEGWFYGLARQYANLYTDTLRAMGATVMVVPIEPFEEKRRGPALALVGEIRSFHPDLAIGLHDAGYALYCRLPRESHDPLTNVFTDWLGLPTVLIWDHALLQFAPLFIGRLPDRPDESVAGCVSLLRRELSHPLFQHVARDSGHRQMVHDLGILPADRLLLEPAFAHPAFWTGRDEAASGRLADLAFIGHVRPLNVESRPARCHTMLEDARESALQTTASDFTRSVQQELLMRMREMPDSLRESLRLDPDDSFYWSYLTSEIDVFQTRLRAHVIDGVDRSLSLFGDFNVACPLGKATRRPERFAFGADLAAAYAGIDVSIDVVNPGFIHGFGTKVMNCFAAGGFMLQDWKKDFVDRFGEPGRAISYSTIDELRAKVDYFSGHERERRTIAAALGETIRNECSLTHFFARVVERALQLAR